MFDMACKFLKIWQWHGNSRNDQSIIDIIIIIMTDYDGCLLSLRMAIGIVRGCAVCK